MPTLLCIHESYGRRGGAEQHLAVIAPYLAKNYRLAFAYQSSTGLGLEAFDPFFTQKFQLSFDDGTQMMDLLNSLQPDVIYLNKCLSIPILQAILQSGIPCIRMVHDHEVYCMRKYKYFPVSRRICHKKAGPCCIFPCLASVQRDRSKDTTLGLQWVSYREQQRLIHLDQQLSAFFVISRYMADELRLQGYDPSKLFLFPPIPTPVTHPVASSFGPENRILFIGQIVRGKGLDCLIRALALVKTPFRLLVCGSGNYADDCKQLADKLGISNAVEFLGFVPHETLPEFYAQANMVVVPSVWPEPFGSVGLEAMQHGLPVIAFDSGGISDWLKNGENGFLIPWMDMPAMAERIEWLLTHKAEARQLGENGQRFVSEHYNFEHYIQRLKDAFNGLLLNHT
jgi:glycosyltransferase involved in cell wall biosynthesis